MKTLTELRGVGPRTLEALHEAGITDIRGLLNEMPRDYRDMSSPRFLSDLRPGEFALVKVRVTGQARLTRGSGITIVRCMLTDGSDVVEAVWYNQPYLKQQLTEGRELLLYGRTDLWKGRTRLVCPVSAHETGIIPVYRKIGQIKNNALHGMIREALDEYGGMLPEELPLAIRERYHLAEYNAALRAVHEPQDKEELAAGRRRFAFEELLLYQLCLMSQRDRTRAGVVIDSTQEEIDGLWKVFPFEPTGAQRRVLGEIASDLRSPNAMARLVQGDVGSGKTAVAFMAMLLAQRKGFQSALMAPTEVLAQQHYEAAKRLLEPLGVNVGLLTGSMTQKQHALARQSIASDEWDCVIGTHALITENVEYARLGLVITDEQHRFGVRQRTALSEKGEHTNVLVMSATPIPRSLALILYGDLDISLVDELPPGKKPVRTRIVPEEKREDMYGFIRAQIAQGHRAYVVCPLVEASETVDAMNAEDVFRETKKRFEPYRTELVHGKMRQQEKNDALEAFRRGDAQVLVSTTVIEVGVNVPEATVMVIENASNFGLAQLHQLRGRVGRGTGDDVPDSWCFLMCEPDERMKLMVSTNDGFVIAKKDMELRGPGELMGTRQTGEMAIGMGLKAGDISLLAETNRAAREIALSGAEEDRQTVKLAVKRYGGARIGLN